MMGLTGEIQFDVGILLTGFGNYLPRASLQGDELNEECKLCQP